MVKNEDLRRKNKIRKITARQARIHWLLNYQPLWEGWSDNSLEARGDPRARDIVERMKVAGVVSKKTYWRDVNLTNLIIDARSLRRTTTKPAKR